MTEPRRIQRSRVRGWKMPPNTVYVGRPSKWGNPYQVHGRYSVVDENGQSHGETVIATPEEAVRAYREWIKEFCEPEDFSDLRGKNLCCWCPLDQPCHADVLLELANPQAKL